MPAATLHLLALKAGTDPGTYARQLQKLESLQVIVASRPRYTVIHPSALDKTPLDSEKWDLLVLLLRRQQPAKSSLVHSPSNVDTNKTTTLSPIPNSLRGVIRAEYVILVGIPSKILSTYPTRDAELKKRSPGSIPLTGSLDNRLTRCRSRESSQDLEISPRLLEFMDDLSDKQNHRGPVTMLNLLQFHFPDGKQSYYEYGQAFVPVAGKRGGNAKIVGNVIPFPSLSSSSLSSPSLSPLPKSDPRASLSRPESEWWNEISIVHYPSIRHFCDMLSGEDYQAINEKYRLKALRDTFLLCTTEFDVETGPRLVSVTQKQVKL